MGSTQGRDAACPVRIPGGHALLSSSLAEKSPLLFGESQCQEEGSGFLSRNVAPVSNSVHQQGGSRLWEESLSSHNLVADENFSIEKEARSWTFQQSFF